MFYQIDFMGCPSFCGVKIFMLIIERTKIKMYNIQNSRNVRKDQILLMSMFICKEFSNFIQEQMFPKLSLPESQSNIDKQTMLDFPCLGGICRTF